MLTSGTGSYLHQTQVQQSYIQPKTLLEHSCQLDIDRKPAYVRQTCAVCTSGDSWSDLEGLRDMIIAGTNIIRLNMTLNTKEHYEKVIENIRTIERELNWNPSVAIAVDLTAPTVRTDLKVILTTNPEFKDKSSESVIFVDNRFFPHFTKCVKSGDSIYLDDGAVTLLVESVDNDKINAVVVLPGELGSLKRLQLSHNCLYMAEHEQSYIDDLKWSKDNKVDMVFTSIDDTAEKINRTKEVLGPEIKVLPKIETKDSVLIFGELLACSDGVIINRGSLGIEYPHEKIFKLQKKLISLCMLAKKPVFVIHQLLESMCYKPCATRAEVCDVANAVLDGADGLILGVETARGEFPLGALKVIHQTCREAEAAIFHSQLQRELKNAQDALCLQNPALKVDIQIPKMTLNENIVCTAALAAVEAAFHTRASAILVPTIGGRSAIEIAAYRPSCPVVAILRRPQVARKLHLYRGVHPYVHSGEKTDDWASDMDLRLNSAMEYIRTRGFISTGEFVVIVNGWNPIVGTTNTVRIVKVPEPGVDVVVLCQAVSRTVGSWPDD